jgi:asparagine synthase (glutamine-hydrolysing)
MASLPEGGVNVCGIAGYWGDLPVDEAGALLQRMNDSLVHRGPDGEGTWMGPRVGLAHRRLAIIDLTGGAQPMASADDRYRIIFNGEIYNYRNLRDELARAGYKFLTRSDTEVIPAAIDHWGIENGLAKLRGMFAFALYDQQNRSLLLARDRFGIKPLYVAHAPGLMLFASEPKALLTCESLDRRADPVALMDFFTLGAALSPRTCWATIKELEPGSWSRRDAAGECHGRFWQWSASPSEPFSEKEAVEKLDAVLTDSLRVHLESDVPVAAFLSGGIDSSVLVALLSKNLTSHLDTFNVGFDDPGYDESAHARAVAERYRTNHHENRIFAGQGTPELFQAVVEQYDQPFGDSSCLPTWIICKEMAQRTKVVISGDGGDELFGGYDRYLMARQLATFGRIPLLPPLVSATAHLLTRRQPDVARRLHKASSFARLPRAQMLCALHTHFSMEDIPRLLQSEFLRQALSDGPSHQRFASYIPAGLRDPSEQLMAAEIRSLLHYDFLRKVDVASSAHGLEVRTPYLDRAVLDLAARLPMSLKIKNKSLKYVLRTLAKKLLPQSVVDRPKQGFAIPFDRWASPQLREFLDDLLRNPSARCRVWLQASAVDGILNVFSNGARPPYLSRFQAYQRVFLLASFELWLRKWSPRLS